MDKPKTVTLDRLKEAAHNIVSEPTGSEFERGILALMAATFGEEGVPSDERMGKLANELGWPNMYS